MSSKKTYKYFISYVLLFQFGMNIIIHQNMNIWQQSKYNLGNASASLTKSDIHILFKFQINNDTRAQSMGHPVQKENGYDNWTENENKSMKLTHNT